MKTNELLTPFERWAVKSNLQTIADGADPGKHIALLHANGYPKIANAVESEYLDGLKRDHDTKRNAMLAEPKNPQ